MSYISFKDISGIGQGVYDMSQNDDPIIMIKMSGGDLPDMYYDSQAANNYNNAIAAGKLVGMYHFAGGKDPIEEADFFISAVSPLAENDVLCLDWEIEHDDPVGWCNSFTTRVHDRTGVWPWIYFDRDRAHRFDWSPVTVNCGHWCPAPDKSFDADLNIPYTVIAQQGPVVNGVDTDVFFGTLDEFRAYGYHAPVPQDPISPIPEPIIVIPPPPVLPNPPQSLIDIVKPTKKVSAVDNTLNTISDIETNITDSLPTIAEAMNDLVKPGWRTSEWLERLSGRSSPQFSG